MESLPGQNYLGLGRVDYLSKSPSESGEFDLGDEMAVDMAGTTITAISKLK